MDSKKIVTTLIPILFFIVAVLFLWYSTGFNKLITFQNDAFSHFMTELREADLRQALLSTLSFMWTEAIFNIFIFLNIVSIGFLVLLVFPDSLEPLVALIAGVIIGFLLFVLTRSIFVLSIFVGSIIAMVMVSKTFKTKKKPFMTGHSFMSRGLKTISIFLVVGFLVAILANMPQFESLISSSNEELFEDITPDSIKEMQKDQIDSIVDGLEGSLQTQVDALPSDVRTQCGPMHTALVTGLEVFRNDSYTEIDKADIDEMMPSASPTFDLLDKMGPLTSMFGLFVIFSLLNPIISVFYGLIYTVSNKLQRNSQSKTSSDVKA